MGWNSGDGKDRTKETRYLMLGARTSRPHCARQREPSARVALNYALFSLNAASIKSLTHSARASHVPPRTAS